MLTFSYTYIIYTLHTHTIYTIFFTISIIFYSFYFLQFYFYILYCILYIVSSGTWTHTVLHYYFLRIACLPISTCLHYYIQKIHYPKNPIRVTPIFLPFYYFPFNPFHHSKIHYQSISFITPLNLPYYLQHKKKTHPNIYIHITLHLLIYS